MYEHSIVSVNISALISQFLSTSYMTLFYILLSDINR